MATIPYVKSRQHLPKDSEHIRES